jgi:hypothetical protein
VPALPSPVLEPSGSRSPRCCHPPGSPPTRLPPPHPRPDHLRRAHPSAGVRLRLRRIADTSCSATTLRRRRDEWISAGWPSSCAVRCWPPTTGCSAWSWSTWWWTAASPRRAAAGRSRAQPGGPPQTRAEALDGHRSGRHPAGHAARPANHATTGCWRRRWSPSPGRRATRTASGAPGRRLRLEALPTGSWPKAGWSARSPH